MSELIRAENLGKVFQKGGKSIDVLQRLNLSVGKGERVAIVGSSGVGKTTLLQTLGALDRPTSGQVFYQGKALFDQSASALASFRNESIGFVFQFHYLLPEFTALENVSMPLMVAGKPKEEANQVAQDWLGKVELSHRLSHRPTELSGGEQQRVAIARALVSNPELVLADEPTGNLDTDTAKSVVELLFRITREGERSLVIVTHNLDIARAADRVLHLRAGELLKESEAL